MGSDDNYEPSPWDFVRQQVEEYEASDGTRANTLEGSGQPDHRGNQRPIIVLTTVGHKTGKVRKLPLMRVEHRGEYALVASLGGAPTNPQWYHNLIADPNVTIQDGPEPFDAIVSIVSGQVRADWWQRAVEAHPDYAEYQTKTDREIPVLVARPKR